MFFKKKEDENVSIEEGAEAPAEVSLEASSEDSAESSEPAAELTPEQLVDQRNAVVVQLQHKLGELRETSFNREQQIMSLLIKARESLNASVKELAASRDIDVDDGTRWNFDLATKEFNKIN